MSKKPKPRTVELVRSGHYSMQFPRNTVSLFPLSRGGAPGPGRDRPSARGSPVRRSTDTLPQDARFPIVMSVKIEINPLLMDSWRQSWRKDRPIDRQLERFSPAPIVSGRPVRLLPPRYRYTTAPGIFCPVNQQVSGQRGLFGTTGFVPQVEPIVPISAVAVEEPVPKDPGLCQGTNDPRRDSGNTPGGPGSWLR